MSTYQIRKGSLLEATRNNSTPSNVLNTTDVSLNTTNLESYKKALHSIVRRLNKTPTSNSKTTIKKLESKLNQTQQPLYNNTFLTTSQTSKKQYMSPSSGTKHYGAANRSQSNERSPYKHSKEILEKSMQEPYFRKESLASNLMHSVSINKNDKHENTFHDDLKGDSLYLQDSTLNNTLLNDTYLNKLDGDGDQKLKELVHKYQLRDAAYRQEIEQLKKYNETLRTHTFELEREAEKTNKSRDLEKRYITKLEDENNQLKERLQQEEIEKKSLTAIMSETKEKQYMKIIEDLKAQVTNLSSEKKLVEHLLKSSIMQKESTKENIKDDRKLSNGILNTLESSSLAVNTCKYSNSKDRVKTANYTKKPLATEVFNDENDYASHSHYQTLNSSFATISLKLDKESTSLKESKQQLQQLVNSSLNFGKIIRVNEGNNTNHNETTGRTEDGDEPFPKKVFHPRTNDKSLKERIDLSQFRLDLTRISKSRKAE